DGDRHREPLTLLFGTLSLGELSVYGFFLISGYLIVQSFDRSPSNLAYLRNRVLRIYPGYAVAYLACIIVVAPLAGADPRSLDVTKAASHLAFLDSPRLVADAFAGTQYPSLNGSMWTIAYEFRCYLFVLAFGALGLFRRGWLCAACAALLLTFTVF